MAKGIWNGGSPTEAIENAEKVVSRDNDKYVGGAALWVGLSALAAMSAGTVITAAFDEGGIDTLNDALEIAGWTSIGTVVGYLFRYISRASHHDGQRNAISNISSGVRD